MLVGLLPVEEEKTTPVFWRDIHYTNSRILEFEKVMHGVAAKGELAHVSIFETFQDAMANGRKLFTDGLHPNNEGHKLIFEFVQPELDKLLNT